MLLTNGKQTTLGQIGSFLAFGLNGTLVSGISQFGKTFLMRLGFGWAWNWCSTMSNTVELDGRSRQAYMRRGARHPIVLFLDLHAAFPIMSQVWMD